MIIYKCDICGAESREPDFLKTLDSSLVFLHLCQRCYGIADGLRYEYEKEYSEKSKQLYDDIYSRFLKQVKKAVREFKEE